MTDKELKKSLEKERKKQREEAIKRRGYKNKYFYQIR